MPSAGRKNRQNRDKPFGLDAHLTACPRCGAAPGERCVKQFGGKTIAAAGPHEARTDILKRARAALN